MDDYDGQNEDEVKPEPGIKRPYRILKIAVDRIVKVAIPWHIQKLKTHCENIKHYEVVREWTLFQSEQVEASNVVRLLKSDLYELRSLSHEVKDEDMPLFQQTIQGPTEEVISAVAAFLEENADAMRPLPKLGFDVPGASEPEFPALICNPNEPPPDETHNLSSELLQVDKTLAEPLRIQRRWTNLKVELHELNELFRKFANFIFSQKESVDKIEDNIQTARDNVVEGSKHLKKAVVLQAATFPTVGAVLGGLLLGPVGAVAGFKLFGSVACAVSGSVIGYSAGWKLKKKRQASCDIEMKAITSSSKSLSISSPDLMSRSDNSTSDHAPESMN